jgi:hypothetical protein
MAYIRGEGRNQGTLFPVVLDDFVPADQAHHERARRNHNDGSASSRLIELSDQTHNPES